MTPTITRQQFIDAIEYGLSVAGIAAGRDPRAVRLRIVARTAEAFGCNYCYGCPVTLAFYSRQQVEADKRLRLFASGFDSYVITTIGLSFSYLGAQYIEVTA